MKHRTLATFIAAATTTTALADTTKLIFNSPAPAPTPFHARLLEGWVEKVNAESNGALNVELITGGTLAVHGQVLDRVQQGVIQIGWDIQGCYPGCLLGRCRWLWPQAYGRCRRNSDSPERR